MDYKHTIVINSTAEKVFKSITEQLEDWWGITDKAATKIGDEFKTSFDKAFWKFRVTEIIPNTKITWLCIDGKPEFNAEWVDTTIYWEIESDKEMAILRFHHVGLTPELKCYHICAPTWKMFLSKSLKNFLENGKGNPHL